MPVLISKYGPWTHPLPRSSKMRYNACGLVWDVNWEHLETSLNVAITNTYLFLKPMWYWRIALRATANNWRQAWVKPCKLTCVSGLNWLGRWICECLLSKKNKKTNRKILDLPSTLKLLWQWALQTTHLLWHNRL